MIQLTYNWEYPCPCFCWWRTSACKSCFTPQCPCSCWHGFITQQLTISTFIWADTCFIPSISTTALTRPGTICWSMGKSNGDQMDKEMMNNLFKYVIGNPFPCKLTIMVASPSQILEYTKGTNNITRLWLLSFSVY